MVTGHVLSALSSAVYRLYAILLALNSIAFRRL
jgi:hypothetical protein